MKAKKYIPLFGRTLLGVLFFQSGIRKIVGFATTQQELSDAGIPLAAWVTLLMIVVELIGSGGLILGYKARIGVLLVLLYLVPSTLIFHNPAVDASQMIEFMKNLAIMGGLLTVVAYGSGPVSLEQKSTLAQTTQYLEH